jgi:hypothetical protein
VLVLTLSTTTLIFALVDRTAVERPVILAFLTTCPGLCILRLSGLKFGLVVDLAYSVTISAVIVGIIAGVTLYARVWSPENATTVLAAGIILVVLLSAFVENRRLRLLRRTAK